MSSSFAISRRRKAGAFLGALALLVTFSAATAAADGTSTAGNLNCSDLIPGSREVRVEPVADGGYSSTDGFSVTVDVRTLEGDDPQHAGNQRGSQVFDFVATGGIVIGVSAKGGPNTNFYDYRPDGVSSGTGLHAPLNGTKFYGLSHISFCYSPVVNDLLRVTKVDPSGATLPGAVFDLYRESNGTAGYQSGDILVDSCTTGTDGLCEFPVSQNGTYYVVESAAPSGYDLPTNPVGTITIVLDAVATTHTFTITDNPTPGTINITKTSDAGPALNGAQFTLFSSDGDGDFEPGTDDLAVQSCTSGDGGTDGACSFESVALGDYWVDETAVPANYTWASGLPVQVTVGLGSASWDGLDHDYDKNLTVDFGSSTHP